MMAGVARTRALKKAALKRQDGMCFYCGCLLTHDEAVMDHLVPQSAGGPDATENRVAACWTCDRAKSNRMPTPEQLDRQARLVAGGGTTDVLDLPPVTGIGGGWGYDWFGAREPKVGEFVSVFDDAEFMDVPVERVTRFYVLAGGKWYRRDNGYRRGPNRYTSRGLPVKHADMGGAGK